MTNGSTTPLFLDKIAKLRTDMKRIEAMQTEMTTLLEGLAQTQTESTEQMSKLIEKLQAVPAAVMEPQSNTIIENCDEELKTLPSRILSTRLRFLQPLTTPHRLRDVAIWHFLTTWPSASVPTFPSSSVDFASLLVSLGPLCVYVPRLLLVPLVVVPSTTTPLLCVP
jgi:hypothetical protein